MFWILSFLPSLIIHLTLLAGVIVFIGFSILGSIPFCKTYKLPGQLLGVFLIVISVFYEGGLSYKEKLDQEVAELRVKLAQAETKSATLNTQLESALNKDTTVIHERGQTIIKYLETDGRKYDGQCVIPPDIINAHNRAATLTTDPTSPPQTPEMPLPPRTSR